MTLVKDLMATVEECGTVHQEMTVGEAIRTLASAQIKQRSPAGLSQGGALLVLDQDNRVVGKIGQTDTPL